MLGLMGDMALTTNSIVERVDTYFGAKPIVTRTKTGVDRSTYAQVVDQARRIATVLDELGLAPDARVATFGWNTARHLALYLAIPSSGRVMHTVNIRYFPEQLCYTVDHAEDEAIFVDRSLLPVLAPVLPQLASVRHVVVMDDGSDADIPADARIQHFEELVSAAAPAELADRVRDERQAAALCYTTGTTGNPKGVCYSHRSMWLHSNVCLTTAAFGLGEADVILPVVPMFHANAWGLPYAALMAGASLVLPGPDLSPAGVLSLLESERVSVSAGVPTIWMGMLALLPNYDLSALRVILCGGSAVPRALSEAWRAAIGIPITQAWGMTETSPVATVGILRSEYAALPEERRADIRATVGMAPPGVEIRIVDSATRDVLPWDDTASGEIECRGPWVATQYFRTDEPGEQFSPDGWLRTGDVATVSEHGYVRLVDRSKDLVKSGGEWISSVALENDIMAHPKVAEAAVIAVTHPKWSERPLACVVVRDGEQLTRHEVLSFLAAKLPKWQLPDDVVFIDEVPKTSVGKFSKKTLRERFADHAWPDD
jgi:fatty-acyl-CoA synthase